MPEQYPPPKEQPPAWSAQAQWAMALLVALALGLATWHSIGRSPWAAPDFPVEKEAVPLAPLPLNEATPEQIAAIPGVGPALARRIVEYRDAHGPFPDVQALRSVRGVGPATLERIRPFLQVGGARPSPVVVVRGSRPEEKPARSRKPAPAEKVDLNAATEKQLLSLPGVGPVLASRIIETRAKGRFRSVEELRRVRGIGAKTLERLRPHVFVSPDGP